jgi:phospholipid/cholesterol/gamma-HCH transport system substrate-binding protein
MSSSRSEEKEQRRFWNEIKVGLLAVGAIALLVLSVRFLEGVPMFGGTYTLVSEFENASGIKEGSPVTVRGLSVGTVQRVELSGRTGGVEVWMQIQGDVELTEGTTASTAGIAALENGHVRLHRAPGGEPLASGARIPAVDRGALDKLRERALPMARRVDSMLADASGTLSEAERVVGRSGTDVRALIDNVRATSADVKSLVRTERTRLHRALVHLERTSASLDTLVADLQHVSSTNRDTLARAVHDAQGTLRHTRRAARSLERSAKGLEGIVADLRDGRGTVGRLLTSPVLYRRMDTITRRVDSILAEFQRRPGRYLDTSVELF